MIPIVLSPSQQTKNRCKAGDSEADHCRLIAAHLFEILKKDSRFVVGVVPQAAGPEINILDQAARYSNLFMSQNGGAKNGLHICIHTDAFDEKSSGVSMFYFAPGGKGEIAAKNIYEELLKVLPYPARTCAAYPQLYELKYTYAPAILAECGFHDKLPDAQYIHDHLEDIAKALAKGVYRTMGLDEPKGKLTWKDLIQKTDDPAAWERTINLSINIAKLEGSVGDLERLQYLPDLLEKIGNR